MPSSPDLSAGPDVSASPGKRPSLLERLMRVPVVRRFFRSSVVHRALAPARGDGSVHRFIRYSMVSAVAIVISQAVILVCTWLLGLSGIAANTIGALAATPASYELNRKWAWGKKGKSHMWREVVPFWALTLVGFLGSTGTVEIADNLAKAHHVTGLSRGLAIMGASLFAYGVVWIVKFFVFNRLVFATPTARATEPVGTGTGTANGNGNGNGTGGGPGSGTGGGQPEAPAFEGSRSGR